MYQGIERRSFGRRESRQHAWIIVSKRTRLPCLIMNFSESGAFLEVSVPPWLPHAFDLLLANGKEIKSCEIRHFGKTGIGVVFVETRVIDDASQSKNATPIDTTVWTGSKPSVLKPTTGLRSR